MAKIVTLRILADDPYDINIADGLNEMLRAAQSRIDEFSDEGAWLIDWSLDSFDSISSSLEDSIVNGTYMEGDFILSGEK